MDLSISSINGAAVHSSQAVQIELHSRINSFSVVVDCVVTDRVTDRDNIPALNMNRSIFNLPRNVKLADPSFHITSKIDILIGAEIFWNLMCISHIKASNNCPTLQKTIFGWILADRFNNFVARNHNKLTSLHAVVSNADLHDQLKRF